MISLIRFTAPRHAIRRAKQSLLRRNATKIVAAPLVSAGVMVGDASGLSSVAHPHVATAPLGPGGLQARLAVPAPAPSTTVTSPPTSSVTTLSIPSTTTSAVGVRSTPSTTATRSAPKPARRPAPPAKAAAPAVASVPRSARTVPLGVFVSGPDFSAIAGFASETDTHPSMGSDYLVGNEGWSEMDQAGNVAGWAGTGYRLVLGVPIIPDGTGGTLAAGATGAYNSYFVTLAQNLVHEGLPNAILRLGWEFNGNWYNWSVANSTDAANFAAYFREIVDSMRSVAGQQFQFVWNPNGSGPTNYTPDQAYPGNAYVDYIGTDIYDNCWCSPQTPQNAWSAQLTQAWGLNWLASFAAEHNKPIGFPEWSVDYRSDGHGLGDDPYFINQFATWITVNNVAFTDIFAVDTSDQQNNITDGSFPNALAAFRSDFG